MPKEALENIEVEDSGKRERSTISFPYGNLDDAVEVAKAIWTNSGQQASMDQLAPWMKHQTVESGAFKIKLYSARIFGLVTLDLYAVKLTELGSQIVDPQSESAARARAFLWVPLYRKLFEKYKGRLLPGDTALESEMGALGVSSKQRSRARQGFQRSAEQAGLFAQGRDRLVLPAGVFLDSTTSHGGTSRKMETPSVQESTGEINPALAALIEELPSGGEWTRDEHDLWMRLFSRTLDKVYKVKES